ncbi:hypothetical protein ACH4M4_31665 [Streptomyces sp. NPDC017254]|uniref:hypothetical protein n=1 Tax=unclassified Streptomyces TaxID=2593676 RepID=UPI003794F576
MRYVVTVETRVPDGSDELEALQQVGASVLLERGFDAVEGIEGPDGVEVDVLEAIVAVYPGGAILKVFVHAPSLEIAEEAVGSVAEDVLDRSELLSDWVVESSEVKLHLDLTRESLEGADGPEAPSSDLEVRRARHEAEAAVPADTEFSGIPEDHEAQIRLLAPRLSSFAPASFGSGGDQGPEEGERAYPVGAGAAELAAGALVYASEVLIDELYDDVRTLAEEESNVAECAGELWHLDRLPPRYALRYDEAFARRFLVTVIALTTRFTDGGFRNLGCLAEGLVLKLLLEEAHATLDLFGLLSGEVAEALECFSTGVYEDRDFEWLYDDSKDGIDEDPDLNGMGITPLGFRTWFTPSGTGRYVHPYAVHEKHEGSGADS